jgi:type III secretion protein W
MRDRALALFGDPAEAYAALSELAESEGDPAAKKLANQAMELIWDQSGPVISASLAGALAGADFPDLGSPLELKSEYVRAAIDFPAPLEMLQDVLKRFGPEGLERGLDYLLKALAADLAAETPSRDKASLTAVSSQLGQVRVLNGVRALGQSLADRWRGVHGQERSRLEDMDFLKFVLEGSREAYPSASLADPLVSRAAPPDIEKETLFRQDLLASVKKVSIEAFGDLDRRERLVGAVQEGLDQAIEREDEWLASLEESQ